LFLPPQPLKTAIAPPALNEHCLNRESVAPPAVSAIPEPGTPARSKRDKSAKSARKIHTLKQINELNQSDEVCEKKSPKKPANLFQKLFRRWEKSGKNRPFCSYKLIISVGYNMIQEFPILPDYNCLLTALS
jgi:hypothetical protein